MADKVGDEDAPKRTYWLKVLNSVQAMTTEDIALVAAHFKVTPYDFIATARSWNDNGRPSSGFRPDVVPHDEDYDISEDPGDYALASKRKQTPGN